MADNRDSRIAELSKRFHTHGVGRPAAGGKNRERTTLYFDADLAKRLADAYKELNYELYRDGGVNKAVFLEAVISYGLEHIEEVKASLLSGRQESPHQQ
jgi:hypothetical protein